MDRTCRACGGNNNYKSDKKYQIGRYIWTITYVMEVRIILKCITGHIGPLDGAGLKMRASGRVLNILVTKVAWNFPPEWTTRSFPK